MAFINQWLTSEFIEKYEMEKDYETLTKPFKKINGFDVFLPFSRYVYSNIKPINQVQLL